MILMLGFTGLSQETEKKENEESKNKMLQVDDIFSEPMDYKIISYNELPGPVKNKLNEIEIKPKTIKSIKSVTLKGRNLFLISYLEEEQLKSIRIKPSGEIEKG
jgi:hypothetical protein